MQSSSAAGSGTTLSASRLHSVGKPEVRTLLRGATVLTMDDNLGDFAVADILLEGSKIVEVGPGLSADAQVVDLKGRIVIPGFIDTHHHQFETAIRGLLADSILKDDGTPEGSKAYLSTVHHGIAPKYRPEDVYISELVASLSQLDAGVTTVLDVSQIHHTPEHSDAVATALHDAGRRAVLGYFHGYGDGLAYPADARRIKQRWFSSDDQLVTMAMGGELYFAQFQTAWAIARELELQIVCHIVGSVSEPYIQRLAHAGQIRDDNLFIHMTGLGDATWKTLASLGVRGTLAVPVEMAMRHGTPPIQKAIDSGLQFSLSSDVECTMSADMFSIMKSTFTVQRMFANEKAIAGEDAPKLLTTRDVLRLATIEGAKTLRLEDRTGSITPGKEADLVVLSAADALNVMPLNNPVGTVVSLMDRSNVEGVMVGGKVRKWAGKLLDVDVPSLRDRLTRSRDHLLHAAGIRNVAT